MPLMFSFFHRTPYHNLNRIIISKQALQHNHEVLQRLHPDQKVCPVLKSNAYGHGLRTVALIFDSFRCPFFVVDSLFEAYEVSQLRVKTPILIMGYTNPTNYTVKRLPFDVALFDRETAQVLNHYQPGCRVHIFVDTGMSREGIAVDRLPVFLTQLQKLKNLHVVGLCSHFADADNPRSLSSTNRQAQQFNSALNVMHAHGFYPQWRHVSASSGAMKPHGANCTMIRAGSASYGIHPLTPQDAFAKKLHLFPALTLQSTLVQIKHISKGATVGYNCTWKAKKDTVLGLLPLGYYEGVDRRLSNCGWVNIKNQFFPIVGRVSMNMTTIDISNLHNAKIGDLVTVYSSNPEDRNSIQNSASLASTNPLDLLVHLSESVKRIVV